MQSLIISALVGMVVVALFCYFMSPLAIRIGLVALPKGRKRHKGRVPLIGGIGMFIGITFALIMSPISLYEHRFLLAGGALLVLTGILDDFKEITAYPRLIAQLLAAIMMVIGADIYLINLGNLLFLGDIELNMWGIPFTIIVCIGITNALNMLDGLDGLAGGISFVMVLWMLILLQSFTDSVIFFILFLLAAVILAFLFFNFRLFKNRPAKIFMGDAGSMFLGFFLVWFAIELTKSEILHFSPVIMLWIMLVPLFDIFSSILRRLWKLQSPFLADRRHFHHLLRYSGFSVTSISIMMMSISVLSGAIAYASHIFSIADGTMFLSFVGLFIVFVFWLNIAWAKVLVKQRPRYE